MIASFHYDRDRLTQFLNDEIDDEASVETAEITSHLESCRECQATLESLLQEGLTMEDAGEYLRNHAEADFGNHFGDGTDDGTVLTNFAASFLEPTDHPDSLGRFARYEIMELLGRGGMGIVMRGYDTSLNRHSAIKMLAPELASSAAARKRFSREAKSAAAVVHPHVVPIQTVDEHNGLPYLVMPVVEGQSLDARVRDAGPLPLIEAVRIATQVAEGLAAAHQQGLVHRDIKPANVLLENGVERVQITDFGLARAIDDASMTRSGVIAGTPQYMSPEQAHGDAIDHRSDLFSLGSLIYFMLTGHSPFRAETTMGVLNRIVNDQPRSIRSINADVPEWLENLVMKLLSKSPGDRYQSSAEIAELLGRWHAYLQQPEVNPPAEPLGKPSSPRGPFLTRWIAAAAAAVAAFMTFAGVLIVLELSKGTLTIQCDADDVPIRILRGGDIVDKFTVTQSGQSVRVAAGNYVVEIDGETDAMVVENGTVTLERGETATVTIRHASESAVVLAAEEVMSADDRDAKRVTIESAAVTVAETPPNSVMDGGHDTAFASTAHAETVSNLTRLMAALHRYQDAQGHLPAAMVKGKDGKGTVPHSWRVELLPLLGEQDLYDQYHFDESWDSEHNKTLLSQMPDVFRCPLDSPDSINTAYFGITSADSDPQGTPGKRETTFFWNRGGSRFRDMLDGTSHTIALVEAKRDIPWTQPLDIEYVQDTPLPPFGGWFHSGWHAGFADGTVKMLASYNDEHTIRSLLTIADGNPVVPKLVSRLEIRESDTLEPSSRLKPPLVTEDDIVSIALSKDQNNPSTRMISLTLSEEAGQRFLVETTRLSRQSPPGYLPITFDGKVLSSPRVMAPIRNKMVITGLRDEQWAQKIVEYVRTTGRHILQTQWGTAVNGLRLAAVPMSDNPREDETLEIKLIVENISHKSTRIERKRKPTKVDVRRTSSAQVQTMLGGRSERTERHSIRLLPAEPAVFSILRIRVTDDSGVQAVPADVDVLIVDENAFKSGNANYVLQYSESVWVGEHEFNLSTGPLNVVFRQDLQASGEKNSDVSNPKEGHQNANASEERVRVLAVLESMQRFADAKDTKGMAELLTDQAADEWAGGTLQTIAVMSALGRISLGTGGVIGEDEGVPVLVPGSMGLKADAFLNEQMLADPPEIAAKAFKRMVEGSLAAMLGQQNGAVLIDRELMRLAAGVLKSPRDFVAKAGEYMGGLNDPDAEPTAKHDPDWQITVTEDKASAVDRSANGRSRIALAKIDGKWWVTSLLSDEILDQAAKPDVSDEDPIETPIEVEMPSKLPTYIGKNIGGWFAEYRNQVRDHNQGYAREAMKAIEILREHPSNDALVVDELEATFKEVQNELNAQVLDEAAATIVKFAGKRHRSKAIELLGKIADSHGMPKSTGVLDLLAVNPDESVNVLSELLKNPKWGTETVPTIDRFDQEFTNGRSFAIAILGRSETNGTSALDVLETEASSSNDVIAALAKQAIVAIKKSSSKEVHSDDPAEGSEP